MDGIQQPSPPRQRHRRGEGDKLRVLILDAATALLRESGREDAVTIRAVTRRAGIAPQSFYLQFRSLSDLLFALYGREWEALHEALTEASNSANTPGERLLAVARSYTAYALNNPGVYRSVMSSHGVLHPEWNPQQLPGAATFALLRDTLQPTLPPERRTDSALHLATTLLWTQLHGISILMIDRPTFPWPPVAALVAGALNGSVSEARNRPSPASGGSTR